MNSQQLHIAIANATDVHARGLLERIKPLFDEVCELERTFVERIDASKAARGEQAPKLRKAKREEVAGYAKDAEEGEAELTRAFIHYPLRQLYSRSVPAWRHMMNEVDAVDGRVDGKSTKEGTSRCNGCGKVLQKGTPVWTYCGLSHDISPFENR
jgi:hypothetical protein